MRVENFRANGLTNGRQGCNIQDLMPSRMHRQKTYPAQPVYRRPGAVLERHEIQISSIQAWTLGQRHFFRFLTRQICSLELVQKKFSTPWEYTYITFCGAQ